MVIRLMVLCALFASVGVCNAAGVYKWVDDTGKVQYSETPPAQRESEQMNYVPSSGASESLPQGESLRGADGQCLTVKCMADEMEAARLQRERDYARQRAENERAAHQTARPVKSKEKSQSALDDHLRENCRRGLFYGADSHVSCDDIVALRKQWSAYHRQQERSRDRRERHSDTLR